MQVAEAGPVPILPDGAPRILFRGATKLDTIFRVDAIPTGPGKVLPRQVTVVAHGMAASAAAASARLGARSALFSRLGDDEYGQRICVDLTSAGVDCSSVRLFPGVASSLCTVIVDDEGVRLVVPYYDACLPGDPGWLPLETVAEADAVQVDVHWPEGAAALLGAARNAGIPAVLDADIGPRDVLMDLARRASHVVFSESGARISSGVEEAEEALTRPSGELDDFVAITLGEKGCIWIEGDEVRRAAGHKVRGVDTLAAGDVFHGGFTWAFAQGAALAEYIAIANAAAAIKCQTFGGRFGAPARDHLTQLFQGSPK